jgi:putative membrane protein
MATSLPKSANDLAGERTDLAVERTFMAANRTMMAWVRTGTSLISFGFTMYKVLAATVNIEATQHALFKIHSPRRIGLFLIALGTASVLMGTIEYFHTVRQLNKLGNKRFKPLNLSLVVGAAVGLLGLFLFATILANKEVF